MTDRMPLLNYSVNLLLWQASCDDGLGVCTLPGGDAESAALLALDHSLVTIKSWGNFRKWTCMRGEQQTRNESRSLLSRPPREMADTTLEAEGLGLLSEAACSPEHAPTTPGILRRTRAVLVEVSHAEDVSATQNSHRRSPAPQWDCLLCGSAS